MYQNHRIAAVVPAYNEERHIGGVIRSMPELVNHLVVVDDASTDGTAERARETGDPRLVLLQHERNTGVGGAVVDGHRAALALDADVVCVMAGDGQSDPAYLPELLGPLVDGRCDVTKANRFFSATSFAGMPRHRVVGNVVLSFLNKLASGYWHVFDPQNGYVALRHEALEALPLDCIGQGYSLENDLLINLNIIGARIADVPIPAVYGDEESTIRLWRDGPAIATRLFLGFFRRIFRKYVLWSFSPVALFLFGGLFLILFGGLMGLWVLRLTWGPPVATTGTVLLSVGPLLAGTNMLLSGLVLDVQEGQRLEVQLDPFGGHATRQRARRQLLRRQQGQAVDPDPAPRARSNRSTSTDSSASRQASDTATRSNTGQSYRVVAVDISTASPPSSGDQDDPSPPGSDTDTSNVTISAKGRPRRSSMTATSSPTGSPSNAAANPSSPSASKPPPRSAVPEKP
jgi:glycosyltransferase involved in cell wall biosynthesis